MKRQGTKTRNRLPGNRRARDRHLAFRAACETACRDASLRPNAIFAGADPSTAALGQADQQPRICLDVEIPEDLQFLIGEEEATAPSEPDEVEGPVQTTADCTCTVEGDDVEGPVRTTAECTCTLGGSEGYGQADGGDTTDVGFGNGPPAERPEHPARAVLSVPATLVLSGADGVLVESTTADESPTSVERMP